MSDEGVRLIIRTALVVLLITAAAFFKVLAGPGKRRGRIMLAGTLGGISLGVLLSYVIHQSVGLELSVILACLGVVVGWGVAWMWARRVPRQTN